MNEEFMVEEVEFRIQGLGLRAYLSGVNHVGLENCSLLAIGSAWVKMEGLGYRVKV
jgi:hypothetical protein